MSTVYCIEDWWHKYEPQAESCGANLPTATDWVKIPSDLNSDGYLRLVLDHPNGGQHLAVWTAILLAAANSKERQLHRWIHLPLRQDNGKPHSASTLSMKTNLPQEWFSEALPRLCGPGIKWMSWHGE